MKREVSQTLPYQTKYLCDEGAKAAIFPVQLFIKAQRTLILSERQNIELKITVDLLLCLYFYGRLKQ